MSIPENLEKFNRGFRFRVDYFWHHSSGDDTQEYVFYTENPIDSKDKELKKHFNKVKARSLGSDFVISKITPNGEGVLLCPL